MMLQMVVHVCSLSLIDVALNSGCDFITSNIQSSFGVNIGGMEVKSIPYQQDPVVQFLSIDRRQTSLCPSPRLAALAARDHVPRVQWQESHFKTRVCIEPSTLKHGSATPSQGGRETLADKS